MIRSELRRFVISFYYSGAFPISILLVKKTDLLVRKAIFSNWQIKKLRYISYIIGFIVIRVIAKGLVIILAGFIIVKIVNIKSTKSLTEVEAIKAIVVDSAKILIGFIVIN